MINKQLATQLILPSPLQFCDEELFSNRGIKLYIKRDDLINPWICGNKWRKLKHHLLQERLSATSVIISFGGPYSNHLIALAKLGQLTGIQTVGIVRSYQKNLNNPLLDLMHSWGMRIIIEDPKTYHFIQTVSELELAERYGISELIKIPMGGTHQFALKGVQEIWKECNVALGDESIDQVWLAVGSGGLLAGLSQIIPPSTQIIAVYPFKKVLEIFNGKPLIDPAASIQHIPCYLNKRFGAYDERIIRFILEWHECHGMWLDPIYTARVMMNLVERVQQGLITEGSNVLFYHSGGLPGIIGYNYQYKHSEIPFLV